MTDATTLFIRGVDPDTVVRFKTLAAHHSMTYGELLAKLTVDAFDGDMDAIMAKFKGGKP